MNNTLTQAIIRHAIDGQETSAVDARSLHQFLEVGKDFSNWIKERIEQYDFQLNVDFATFTPKQAKTPKGGRPVIEYALTVDMAKELCMVERNDRGKEARRYFIEMEGQAKALAGAVPQSLPEALRLAANLAEKAERQAAQIKELAPKAEFHDKVAEAINAQTIAEVAKILGSGQNRFFQWLRDQGILMKTARTVPYQQYIDAGYFRLVERQYNDARGESHTYVRTLVTGKGFAWLQRLFDNQGQIQKAG